jgi:hypothetical protein
MLRINPFMQSPATGFNPGRRVGKSYSHDWRLSAYSLLFGAVLLIIFSSWVHGDDLTGMAQDDPKDLTATPVPAVITRSCDAGLFVPMPAWARKVVMPPLPLELQPMGGKTKVAGPPSATPAVNMTKDANATAAANAAAAKPPENPAMVTVSPFLQWIKSNPQAAAAQARQQAEIYHTGPTPPTAATANNATPAANANAAQGSTQDNYWLPPLIDSPDFGSTAVGGSSAIYSTPQR